MLLDKAQDLVAKNIPKPTEAEPSRRPPGIEREIKLGWCEIQNAGSELSIMGSFDALWRQER